MEPSTRRTLAPLLLAVCSATAAAQHVRELVPSGVIDSPAGVCVDAAGTAFVVGLLSDDAVRVTPGGKVTTLVDAAGAGPGMELDGPSAIAVDATGNVYVAGSLSDNVLKIAPDGTVTQIADTGGAGGGMGLLGPSALAVDSAGNVYVAGSLSDNVLKIAPGGLVTQIVDAGGAGAGMGLDAPSGLAVDALGNVYVAGRDSDNVLKIAPGGAITQVVGAAGAGAGMELDGPSAVAVDAQGNLFVCGALSDNVLRADPMGTVEEVLDASGDGQGELVDEPSALAVSPAGALYVTSLASDRIFKVSWRQATVAPATTVEVEARIRVATADNDHPGPTLDAPTGVAVDPSGSLLVTGGNSDNVLRAALGRVVASETKISQTEGLFGGALPDGHNFGFDLTPVGDFGDGAGGGPDGIPDVVVRGSGTPGTLWILYLDVDGTVKGHASLAQTCTSVTCIGDFGDGFGGGPDGIPDLAVGDKGTGLAVGSVRILFLDADFTLKGTPQTITNGMGGLPVGTLGSDAEFGTAVAWLGDKLAVGAPRDASFTGKIFLLTLNPSGTVAGFTSFTGSDLAISGQPQIGHALASLGDIDGNGTNDLAFGWSPTPGFGSHKGGVRICLLESGGSVGHVSLITENQGGFTGQLDEFDSAGLGLTTIADLDGNGIVELAMGAPGDDDGGASCGAVWLLFLEYDAADPVNRVRARDHRKISHVAGDLVGQGPPGAGFGQAVAALDLDGDLQDELVVGANLDDDGGTDRGAVWILGLCGRSTTWTGAASADWPDPGNWSDGVPSAESRAIVPVTGTAPVVAGAAACGALELEVGATVTVPANGTLAVFGDGVLDGDLPGPGQLRVSSPGTWSGAGTITGPVSLEAPTILESAALALQDGLDVRADLALVGPSSLDVTGAVAFDDGVGLSVDEGAMLAAGSALEIFGDVLLDGALVAGGDVILHGDLFGTSEAASIEPGGTGNVFFLGSSITWPGITVTVGIIVIGSPGPTLVDVPPDAFPAAVLVLVDSGDTVTLLNDALNLPTRLDVLSGTLAFAGDITLTVPSLRVFPAGVLEAGANRLSLPGATTLEVLGGGLHVGAGGALALNGGSVTVDTLGTLRVVGAVAAPARVETIDAMSTRFAIALADATLEAQHFRFAGMDASGLSLSAATLLGSAPLDLRDGVFDRVDPGAGSVLLSIDRPMATSTSLESIDFQDSDGLAGSGVFNVRAPGAQVTLVDWTGPFGGPVFEEPTTGANVVWGAQLDFFTVRERGSHNDAYWRSVEEVPGDLVGFVLERRPVPGAFGQVGTVPRSGPALYTLVDDGTLLGFTPGTPYVYRLQEELTGGVFHVIATFATDGIRNPASRPGNVPVPVLPLTGGGGPRPPVRPGSGLGDVLQDIRLPAGTHEAFVVDAASGPLVRVRGATDGASLVDTSSGPVRIQGLAPDQVVILEDLTLTGSSPGMPALCIEDCQGLVVLSNLDLRGLGESAAAVRAARAVELVDCDLGASLTIEDGASVYLTGSRAGRVLLGERSRLVSWALYSKVESTAGSVWEPHEEARPRLAATRGEVRLLEGAAGSDRTWFLLSSPAPVATSFGPLWLASPAARLVRWPAGERAPLPLPAPWTAGPLFLQAVGLGPGTEAVCTPLLAFP